MARKKHRSTQENNAPTAPAAASGRLSVLLSGTGSIGKSIFSAGGDAGEAADAVGMAHKIGVGYINVHGAGLAALPAAPAAGCILADAEKSQHTPQPLSCAPGAEIVAEGAVDEQGGKQKDSHDCGCDAEQLPMQHARKLIGTFEQREADTQCQQKVKHVAADLQIALHTLRHTQARQMQLAPQPSAPILRRT